MFKTAIISSLILGSTHTISPAANVFGSAPDRLILVDTLNADLEESLCSSESVLDSALKLSRGADGRELTEDARTTLYSLQTLLETAPELRSERDYRLLGELIISQDTVAVLIARFLILGVVSPDEMQVMCREADRIELRELLNEVLDVE
ncbi:MAG: hypothetical protein ABJD13_03910 [Paracoccaceae bacterium]